jgi:hypothetical protein
LRTLRDNLHQQLCSLLIRDSNAGASIFGKKSDSVGQIQIVKEWFIEVHAEELIMTL